MIWPFRKKSQEKSLSSVHGRGGWFPLIREPFTGAWQRNKEITAGEVRDFFAIYACKTLITGDISKMAIDVKRRDSQGTWTTDNGKIHQLLLRPNRYQTGLQFRQWWMQSKLEHGNTYIIKQRDAKGSIVALYVLDPPKVTPLVADDGSVYYRLGIDSLGGVEDQDLVVPASEIIHDRYQPQYHPLIGISPVYAAALAGALGKQVQRDGYNFFLNGANLSGILTAPGSISADMRRELEIQWRENYTGDKAGGIAVVSDGLTFVPMRAKGVDSQIVEQLRLSAEVVASCFHVPPFKIGMARPPEKPQEANLIYYSDCLQVLIEEMEACLDSGLELSSDMRVEHDTDDLLRMDKATVIDMLSNSVRGSVSTPNEARSELGLRPLDGGDSIYMQQQNYSLEALAKRDAQDNPFAYYRDGSRQYVPVIEPDDDKNKADDETARTDAMLDTIKIAELMGNSATMATEPLRVQLDYQQRDIDAIRADVAALKSAPVPVPVEIDFDAIAAAAAKLIPAPKDGADGLPGINGKDGADGKDGLPGINGKDGADGKDGLPGINGKDGADGAPGVDGKDGKDGLPGKDAEPVSEAAIADSVVAKFERRFSDLILSWERQARDAVAKAIDALPAPRDGVDGLPAEDIQITQSGRDVVITVGTKSHTIRLNTLLDRGVWKEGPYECGDGVTYGGSYWIAQSNTSDAPGTSNSWRLAVKKGRDGRDLRDSASAHDKTKGLKI